MNEYEINEVFTNPSKHIFICREFELKPKNIATLICALANTATGYIFIGAVYNDDKFIINGISKSFHFNGILEESKKMLSEIPMIEYKTISIENINLLVIKVYKQLTSLFFDGAKYILEGIEIVKCKEDTIMDTSKVFIVHGHDNEAKQELARYIEKLGLGAIILHEQVSRGNTIIEKIEEYSNVGFAIALYTPCDEGRTKGEIELNERARQNVVFEHGFLMGKIGRGRVCALVKGSVEKPNDISGVVYIDMDDGGAWKVTVAQELKSAGYQIDFNKVFE